MQIEINLLGPEKRLSSRALILMISLTSLPFIATMIIFVMMSLNSIQHNQLQQELQTTRQLRMTTEESLSSSSLGVSFEELQQAVGEVEKQTIQVVPFLQYLHTLLPTDTVIQSLEFDKPSTVRLQVLVLKKNEAAEFLAALQSSERIESSQIVSLTTTEEEHYEATYQIRMQQQEKEEQP